MPELPSGTVTFLFTDLEGSTRLWEQEPDAMRSALARHDAIVADAIAGHGGHVVKTTGDGFHAAFNTAADALRAAMDAQSALRSAPWETTDALSARMGLHTGEAEQRDGDYYGTAVNRAARLMAVAHGGQIICSHVTLGVAGDGFPVQSLGEHRLRDLSAPEELFQIGAGVFPPLRSVDVVPTNLPVVRTELIGRQDEIAALSELVLQEQLVTLTGVGGVGKTRLALAVTAAVSTSFPDGCWLAELAPVAVDDDVATLVATAVRSPVTGLDSLAAYLADRRVLIVLDNCEHVLDGAVQIADVLLSHAPDVHVLVTSREPLGLDGEQVRRVRSLEVPDHEVSSDAARAASAVRLFTDRAVATAEDFVVDDGNVTAIVDICRRLDGIPLAIELAAARVRSMPPDEIARRLDERFRLLGGGSRRTQERHRTLFATVSWSFELLTEHEKMTLRRLAVFPASFDLCAAEAVAGSDVAAVVDIVSRLVDRSLVVYEPRTGRYRLLETLRQFAADRLAEAGEIDMARARHADHFLALVTRWDPLLQTAEYDEVSEDIAPELDNLRTVADWCIDAGNWDVLARMSRALWYFSTQSAPVDGVAWYRAFLAHADALDAQLVADAFGELAFLQCYNFADFDAASASIRSSRTLTERTGGLPSPAAWLSSAMVASFKQDPATALSESEQGVAIAEARGDENMVVSSMLVQPPSLCILGEYDRAADIAHDVLARAKRFGHPTLIAAAVIVAAGMYAWSLREPDFVTALEILERERVGRSGGEVSGMFLGLIGGYCRLGLDRTGALEEFAWVARAADRVGASHVLERALTGLAIVAAEADCVSQARALAAFTERNLQPFRMGGAGEDWLETRLRDALDARENTATVAVMHRGEIMRLVDELEVALAP